MQKPGKKNCVVQRAAKVLGLERNRNTMSSSRGEEEEEEESTYLPTPLHPLHAPGSPGAGSRGARNGYAGVAAATAGSTSRRRNRSDSSHGSSYDYRTAAAAAAGDDYGDGLEEIAVMELSGIVVFPGERLPIRVLNRPWMEYLGRRIDASRCDPGTALRKRC